MRLDPIQNDKNNIYSRKNISKRYLYPAIVIPGGTNDKAEHNRIQARIVSIDDTTGKIIGKTGDDIEKYNNFSGKDMAIADENIVTCIPLLPQFFYVKPQPGEMVFVFLENPSDNTSVRYWIGPIVSSKLKLSYQKYEDAVKIFNKTKFFDNKKLDNTKSGIESLYPTGADVAIQGRNDADLILKKREALLIAGKFNKDSFTVNDKTPSFIRIRQIPELSQKEEDTPKPPPTHLIEIIIDNVSNNFNAKITVKHINSNLLVESENDTYEKRSDSVDFLKDKIKEYKIKYIQWSFNNINVGELKNLPKDYLSITIDKPDTIIKNVIRSEAEITSTDVLIYSPNGKNRGEDIKGFEINEISKTIGELADKLHPLVFGDELIRLLNLIITYLLNHIHQPQNPPLSTSISDELKKYNIEGKLQNIISNQIRIN